MILLKIFHSVTPSTRLPSGKVGKELSAKIVSLQRADGSWANENNRFWESDPVLCTSFALLALELCR